MTAIWIRRRMFLPNVQDEPRPWLARLVLLGARDVTAMVVGSGALFGALVSDEDEPSSAYLHGNRIHLLATFCQTGIAAARCSVTRMGNITSQRTSLQRQIPEEPSPSLGCRPRSR